MCYSYMSGAATRATAQTMCAAAGGALFTPSSGALQQAVEQYMSSQGPLLSYWTGLRRAGSAAPYTHPDGTALPQVPSADPGYAHWTANYTALAAGLGNDCVLASSLHAYDM
jgi:hypothetical protein